MKNILICAVLFLMFVIQLSAQENSTTDTKLDSILHKQDKMLDKQDKIFEEVKYDDPLATRHAGVEFNPALFLAGIGNESLILSGGFSLFNAAPNAELAFPVWYHSEMSGDTYKVLTVDAVYRYYFGKYRRGFYISGGLRYAYLEGENTSTFWDEKDGFYRDYADVNSAHKFGVHFGIGVRLFARNGLYWGAGIITGTYFSDESDKLPDGMIDAGKFLFDIELLKFGYAF